MSSKHGVVAATICIIFIIVLAYAPSRHGYPSSVHVSQFPYIRAQLPLPLQLPNIIKLNRTANLNRKDTRLRGLAPNSHTARPSVERVGDTPKIDDGLDLWQEMNSYPQNKSNKEWTLVPVSLDIHSFKEDTLHRFVKCNGLPDPFVSKFDFGLLVLDIGITKALTISMFNWTNIGMLDLIDEKILFIQNLRAEHCSFGYRHGFTTYGNTGNVGIGSALEFMIKIIKSEAVLFLERDWHVRFALPNKEMLYSTGVLRCEDNCSSVDYERDLSKYALSVHDPSVFPKFNIHTTNVASLFMASILMGSVSLVYSTNISAVFLRFPEENLHGRCRKSTPRSFFIRKRDPCDTHGAWFASGFSPLFNCPILTVQKFKSLYSTCSRGPEPFFCIPSSLASWSNNPSVFRRSWALEYIAGTQLPCHSLDESCLYAGVELNGQLQCKVKHYNGQMAHSIPGLFVHRDLRCEVPLPPDEKSCPSTCRSISHEGCPNGWIRRNECCCMFPFSFEYSSKLNETLSFTAFTMGPFNSLAKKVSRNEYLVMKQSNTINPVYHDYSSLMEFVKFSNSINDQKKGTHREVVFTAFFASGFPNFTAMKLTGCPMDVNTCRYVPWSWKYWISGGKGALESLLYHSNTSLLQKAPVPVTVLQGYWELYRSGVWKPEYSSRNFVNVLDWTSKLSRQELSAWCFEKGLMCGALKPEYFSEVPYDWISKGLEEFSYLFGFNSYSTHVPANTAYCHLGASLYKAGVFGLDSTEALPYNYRAAIQKIKITDKSPRTPPWKAFGLNGVAQSKMIRANDVRRRKFVSIPVPIIMKTRRSQKQFREYISSMNNNEIIVTQFELNQIQQFGFSVERWSDHYKVKNFLTGPLRVSSESPMCRKGDAFRIKTLEVKSMEIVELNIC